MYPPKLKALAFCGVIFLLFIINSGCEKHVRVGSIQAGVALTFDDNWVDDWYNNLDLLDSFGAKATFYISSYHKLTAQQKQRLKTIQQKGHEIAFHTTNHAHMVQMLKNHPMKQVLDKEIYQGLNNMAADGFYPTDFAYPFGRHNPSLDSALLKIFHSIRSLNGTEDYSKSVVKSLGTSRFRSLNMDNNGLPINKLLTMLECARNNNNCVVFLAHKIENGYNLSISRNRLRQILIAARDENLRFYTIKELAR
jgi:peptidoglycan/xylan/chitin deacetylase (PgdA/CDA1 family)